MHWTIFFALRWRLGAACRPPSSSSGACSSISTWTGRCAAGGRGRGVCGGDDAGAASSCHTPWSHHTMVNAGYMPRYEASGGIMCGLYASLQNARHRQMPLLYPASATPPFFKWVTIYGTLKSRGSRVEDEVRAGQGVPWSKTEGGADSRPNDAGRAGRTCGNWLPGVRMHGMPRRLGTRARTRGIGMDGWGDIQRGQEVRLFGGWAGYSPADVG